MLQFAPGWDLQVLSIRGVVTLDTWCRYGEVVLSPCTRLQGIRCRLDPGQQLRCYALAARPIAPPPLLARVQNQAPSKSRLAWGGFPLSVSGAEYTILAKAMQLQLDDVQSSSAQASLAFSGARQVHVLEVRRLGFGNRLIDGEQAYTTMELD